LLAVLFLIYYALKKREILHDRRCGPRRKNIHLHEKKNSSAGRRAKRVSNDNGRSQEYLPYNHERIQAYISYVWKCSLR
jgi:hypothetical protein